jgi:cysteine desulfurase
LYVKKGTSIAPIITGGNQEFGLRSGTENVPYIVGFGKAVEISLKMREKESLRLSKLRDYFIGRVLEKIPKSELNGSRENRIANNANFLFRGVSANNLLIALDQAGIAASSGSTCAIKTVSPSEVLIAIGRSEEESKQSVRFTLGRGTTKKDIDYTVAVLLEKVK